VPEAAWVDQSLRNLYLGPLPDLCLDTELLRVRIPRPDGGAGASPDGWDSSRRRPYWVAWLGAVRRAITLFRICGVVVLDKVLPDELTASVHEALLPVQKRMTDHATAMNGERNASWEMLYNPVTPGARRYHGRVPLVQPFTDPALIWAPALREVLTSAMGHGNRQLEIGRYSFVTAEPGSGDQNWHKDVSNECAHREKPMAVAGRVGYYSTRLPTPSSGASAVPAPFTHTARCATHSVCVCVCVCVFACLCVCVCVLVG
jgi:hypothetical protein